MSPTLQSLLDAALKLPQNERASLAGHLLDSLDRASDEGVTAAWDKEVARRVAELDAGTAKLVPWSQVREELRAIVDAAAQ